MRLSLVASTLFAAITAASPDTSENENYNLSILAPGQVPQFQTQCGSGMKHFMLCKYPETRDRDMMAIGPANHVCG
jgi:hypothetical protein